VSPQLLDEFVSLIRRDGSVAFDGRFEDGLRWSDRRVDDQDQADKKRKRRHDCSNRR
jgi:hypothetical protein